MTDIRLQSDEELSLLVYNTEYLYKLRFGTGFLDLIERLYIYRPEQLQVLINDIREETNVEGYYGEGFTE